MATGMPVIGSNVDGINNIIDRNTGILFEANDQKGLEKAIVTCHESRDLLGSMKIAAREKAVSNWRWEVVVQTYIDFYRNT